MSNLRDLQKFMAQMSDRFESFVDEMEAIGVKVKVSELRVEVLANQIQIDDLRKRVNELEGGSSDG